MKKIQSLFLLATLIFSLSSFTFAQEQTERIIIVFKSKVDNIIAQQAHELIIRVNANFPALAITVPVSAINGLLQNPNVLSIEEDILLSISETQTQDRGIVCTAFYLQNTSI